MHNETGVELKNPGVPGEVRDALTDVLRHGAHQLLTQAIETEVAEFLTRHRDARDEAGRRRIVRNGYLPPHTIQTGIGDVPVKATRVRDRAGEIRFTSSIPPLYLRLTKTRPNQVWAADITYIPMTRDFVYLCAVLDWASRRVLAWRLANTLTTDFCLEAIREAVTRYGTPDIFNTDQGSQFTAWSLPGSSRSTA